MEVGHEREVVLHVAEEVSVTVGFYGEEDGALMPAVGWDVSGGAMGWEEGNEGGNGDKGGKLTSVPDPRGCRNVS